MPYDSQGEPLAVGDHVMIEFAVMAVPTDQDPQDGKIHLQLIDPNGDDPGVPLLYCEPTLVTKVDPWGDEDDDDTTYGVAPEPESPV